MIAAPKNLTISIKDDDLAYIMAILKMSGSSQAKDIYKKLDKKWETIIYNEDGK